MTLVFADPKHLKTLAETGKYPRIHDAITAVVTKHTPISGALVVEFGACLGLISHRLIEQSGAAAAIAIEANNAYIARAIQHPALEYAHVCVSSIADLAPLTPLLRKHRGKPRVAVARRVLSEIWTSGQQVAIDAVAQWLHQNDVGHLVLEGRALVNNPTHPIHSGEIEAAKVELTGLYKTSLKVGHVFVMEAV